MRILMVSSEIKPFSKTGGMGEVVFSLSKELAALGNELILLCPLYKYTKDFIKKKKYKLKKEVELSTMMNWRVQHGEVYSMRLGKLHFYFIDNPYYFDRPNLYGYEDDSERFAYFCVAAKEASIKLEFNPEIVHVHDWQSAFLPVLVLEDKLNKKTYFKKTKFFLTIHNPAFKGYMDKYCLHDYFNLPDNIYENGDVRLDNMVSTLKAGIVYSDYVTTVSPTHKNELLYDIFNFGLSGALRLKGRHFVGILNGINIEEYSPEFDTKIPANYGYLDVNSGKAACKNELLRRIRNKNNNVPVFGLVSRLSDQKGIQLLLDVIRGELEKGSVFAIVGEGNFLYEKRLEDLKKAYPTQMFLYVGFSDEDARLVFSASDFFLMPSFFEPCGIGQMMAQRYAAIPIVRRTGGLTDTVDDYFEYKQKANGILFSDFDSAAIRYGISTAYDIFENKSLLTKIRKNCLETDNSWKKSAKKYNDLYMSAVK